MQATAAQTTSIAYLDYLRFDPRQAPKTLCPVLIVQGMADAVVSPAPNLEQLQKNFHGHAAVTELRLKGLDHALRPAPELAVVAGASSAPVLSDAQTAISDWINGRK